MKLNWRYALLIGLLHIPMCLAAGNALAAETLSGKVVGVTDGDTITVLDTDNRQHTIRLFAIDAPETSCHAKRPSTLDDECVEHSQPFGKAAKRSLASLVFGKQVDVVLESGSTYGREIGTIWSGNTNANLEQVKRGYAWVYRKYTKHMPDTDRNTLDTAEANAQGLHLGLWSDRSPTPPWEWRHKR